MEKTQSPLSPAESVTSYLIKFVPTFIRCGGSRPLRFKGPLELSVGTGTCHVTIAYDFPAAVGVSMLRGHSMLGG